MQIGTPVSDVFGSIEAVSPLGKFGAAAQEEVKGKDFVTSVTDAATGALNTLVEGEQTAKAMMAGKADAHSVVEALAATEMALEAAVSIRDKVVEAYQEILRMPI